MAKFYAWSNIYNGGETKEVTTSKGLTQTIVVNRNIIPAGEEITKAKAKMTDEDWDEKIAGGSIRTYPMPDEADEVTSPTQAVISRLTSGTGEIDPDMLLELTLGQPAPANPPAEEAKEVETKPVGVK
jgi:hypothetical protein